MAGGVSGVSRLSFFRRLIVGWTALRDGVETFLDSSLEGVIRTLYGTNGIVTSAAVTPVITGLGGSGVLNFPAATYRAICGGRVAVFTQATSGFVNIPFDEAGGLNVSVAVGEYPEEVDVGTDGTIGVKKWAVACGEQRVPTAVAEVGAGLKLTLDVPAWTKAAGTRPVVAWLAAPETGSAEAIYVGVAELDGADVVVNVTHQFGQGSPSVDPADYVVFVKGPVVDSAAAGADAALVCEITAAPAVDASGQTLLATVGGASADLTDHEQRISDLEAIDSGTRLDIIDAEDGAGTSAAVPGLISHATDTGVVTTTHTRTVVASTDCQSNGANSANVASDSCIATTLRSGNFASYDNCEANGAESANVACVESVADGDVAANVASWICAASGIIASANVASQNSEASGEVSANVASNTSATTGTASATIASSVCTTSGGVCATIASRNCENATNHSLALGYDAGAAITPSGSDQNLTIKLAANGGNGTCDGSWTGGGADYAEFFENADPGEIGACLLVARKGRHVRPASAGDRILGVASPNPGIVGNAAGLQWQGRKKRDELGRVLTREVECVRFGHKPEPKAEKAKGKDAKPESRKHYDGAVEHCPHEIPADAERYTITTYQEVEGYERGRKYLPRSERPAEWTCVGLMGQLRVRVDATVTDATEFIAPVEGGIGGHSDAPTNCEVMELLTPFDKALGYGVALCFVR